MNRQRRNPPPPLLIVHSFFLPLANGNFFFPLPPMVLWKKLEGPKIIG